MGLFKKNDKQTAVAFVDEWYNEICSEYKLENLYFYGDFNNRVIGPELEKLSKYTRNVIHTASMKDGVDKDFTDFIILDAIYREAAKKKSPDVFIIFTGDGHFDLAVKYLRELNKKVIIYAVKFALSNKLKSSANSYVEMPRQTQEQQFYINLIIDSLKRLKNMDKVATYWKTVNSVAEYNKISPERIQMTLDGLLNQKYLYEEESEFRGRKQRILKADWKRIEENLDSNNNRKEEYYA